jgi:hypothetical protein
MWSRAVAGTARRPAQANHGSPGGRFVAAILAIVLAVPACEGSTTPSCPSQPSSAVDYGSPAPRASSTSIDFELSQRYMRTSIHYAVATPETATSGVHAGFVTLLEKTVNGEKLNVVEVTIRPWLRGSGATDAPVEFPGRSYILRLKLVPYLITPETIPDEAKRRAILGDTDAGAVLRTELYELWSNIHQEPVSCGSKNFDFIDSSVLGGIYDSVAKAKPLVLPADQITGVATKLTGTAATLKGINVGSDLELKIGFELNAGVPSPFSSQAFVSRFSTADWGIRMDTNLFTSAITASVNKQITASYPTAALTSLGISFTPDGIDLNIGGSIGTGPCGTVTFTSKSLVTPLVRKNAEGTSLLLAPSSAPNTSMSAGATLCVLLDSIGRSFADPLGSATLDVRTGGCLDVLAPVQFSAGKDPKDPTKDDVFYATDVDTDTLFYIAGRSTFIDRELGPRPDVPSC